MEFSADAIIAILRPGSLGDVFIYIIFFGALIATMIMPEKNEVPMYLMFAVMFACVIDLLRSNAGAAFPLPGFDDEGFGTFLLHILMFVFPLVGGGMIRRPPSRKGGLAMPWSIVVGLIAAVYAFGAFAVPSTFYSQMF